MRSSSGEVVLLLADGRWPSGGHAHSGGLEGAVADGAVHDLASLRSFLVGRLASAGVVEAWAAAWACAGDEPAQLEAEFEARTVVPSLRSAARSVGRGLRRSARVVWPDLEIPVEAQPVVVGLVARRAGCSPTEAAALVLHALAAGVVAAAPRLFALDTAEVMAVAVGLAPMVDRVAAEAATSAEPPLRASPLVDLRAQRHAAWEVRLFAS